MIAPPASSKGTTRTDTSRAEAGRRRMLAAFVRARREAMEPASHGFTDLRRRRTPGLRREELAQLAGLSATWLSWIEQAREVSLSAPAVGRLARAFGLSPAERAYLFDLAGKEDPDPPAAAAPETLNPLLRLIEAVPFPAYLLDGGWDAIGWNAPASALFRGWLDIAPDTGRPNLLRFIFATQAAPALIPDHEARARRVLAEFRADTSRHMSEPALAALVAELRDTSPLFARLWDGQAVLGREGGLRTFLDADGAVLRFDQLTLAPLPGGRARLVVLTPRI
ncbi:transcriptional regulator [Azorhizobium oxalatiphilum]|uniref:Transcriptional regulator n=1 Tax=Azorhizobium oxalatiphilum TaxID=980631 RepID=A0A917FGZ1_9HYPH|nr:helix-turn-helix transcriptional regulator [Azorhizobium oxalatiphilum]GGF76711.1 transcriptional regulator [Azorhizobium oxalatiphilum]